MTALIAHATIRLSRPGVMPFPRGEWSAAVTDYKWDNDKRDLVYYNKLWYAVKKFDPLTPVPKGSVPSGSSEYWVLSSQFEMVITSMMMADAIRTNALNINDNFTVTPQGFVTMKGATTEGIFHSLGPNTELFLSDGYMRVLWKGVERMRLHVDETAGLPSVYLVDKPGTSVERSATVRVDGISFMRNDKKVLNMLVQDIGYGNIFKRPDGTLALDSSTTSLISCYTYVSPPGSGTISPFTGTELKTNGSTEVVAATPANGYKFDRWSDGGAQSHTVTWTGQTLTAFFKLNSVVEQVWYADFKSYPTAMLSGTVPALIPTFISTLESTIDCIFDTKDDALSITWYSSSFTRCYIITPTTIFAVNRTSAGVYTSWLAAYGTPSLGRHTFSLKCTFTGTDANSFTVKRDGVAATAEEKQFNDSFYDILVGKNANFFELSGGGLMFENAGKLVSFSINNFIVKFENRNMNAVNNAGGTVATLAPSGATAEQLIQKIDVYE